MKKETVIEDLQKLIKEPYFVYGWVPKEELAKLILKYKGNGESK